MIKIILSVVFLSQIANQNVNREEYKHQPDLKTPKYMYIRAG